MGARPAEAAALSEVIGLVAVADSVAERASAVAASHEAARVSGKDRHCEGQAQEKTPPAGRGESHLGDSNPRPVLYESRIG